MKVAIVAHGRFHAFDLARALLARGVETTVFTNYPRFAASRFQIPRDRVRSYVLHGALARVLSSSGFPFPELREKAGHRLFGRWASRALAAEPHDVAHVWSGVAEEAFTSGLAAARVLMRGSAHIQTQAELLQSEGARLGLPVTGPSRWMIDREEREYAAADKLVVLSRFAWNSFIARGVPSARLRLLPLGSDLARFRPGRTVAQSRRQRLLAHQPLRILYVGGLTLRKGAGDLARIVGRLPRQDFHFRLVGPMSREVARLRRTLERNAEVVGKVPHGQLPRHYDWADVFMFPTVEDGYAVVLAQAAAAGLPIIATANCAAPDFVQEGRNGWIVPIQDPDAFVARLQWCRANRAELADMASRVYAVYQPRDWGQVAAEFEALCRESR